MIAFGVITHTLFLAIILLTGNWLGTDPSIKTPLFLAAFSFGIFVGTFLYVMGDGLVFKTIIGNKLTRYPRELRERRQDWVILQIPIVLNMLCVIAMAIVLKKNLSGFYSSVVEQMENLSSEKKDLTRRINVCSVDENSREGAEDAKEEGRVS